MPALRTSAITKAYSGLWTRFTEMVDSARLTVKADGGLGFRVKPDKAGSPCVEAMLYLPDWPSNASSPNRVDILVRVRETFSSTHPEISSCSTQIGYFRADEKRAWRLLELHYDFSCPPKKAHPIFHAQVGAVDWPQDDLNELGFRRTIQQRKSEFERVPRIATPYMGYAAILLSLAADHIDHQSYDTFLQKVRKNDSLQWKLACEQLVTSMKVTSQYPYSHHWY